MSQDRSPDYARAQHEIAHGEWLADRDTETVWGWGSPAGRLRARRRANLILDGAHIAPGQRVLEIGCGTGFFTEMFAATGARIFAVDISAPLVAKARTRGLDPNQVTFCVGRFEDCKINGPFDSVIGSSILHHLELQPALGRVHALLKPGGWMSFAEPNMLNPQVFLERKFHFLPMFSYTSPDETAFVRWQLKAHLQRAGFSDIDITPFDWLHPSTPARLIRMISATSRLFESVPCIREFSGSLYIRARRRE